jgi:predicted RNA binding protein YcfA (HicA-like mRNA interferase family)
VAKNISRREVIRKFRRLGFSGPFSGGRHQFMQKGALKLRIPNPHGGDIHISLLKEILRQGNISWQEWEDV